MNRKSLEITTGAMSTAIFGALMLLNRQTGSLFEGFFVFLYPIPLAAYSAMYGIRSGLPALAAMSLLSFLFGDFTSIFYAVAQALIGLVFGGCLYHKVDMTKTLFAVMLMSAVENLLDIVVLGFLYGVDLNQQTAEMRDVLNTAFEQVGQAVPSGMFSDNYIKQLIIVSMIVAGILQGFLVYEISLQILRRLRFPVQKPKSVYLYMPPKMSGYIAALAYFFYNLRMVQPLDNELLQNVALTVGMLGYMYLICFGIIGLTLILGIYFPRLRVLRVVIALLGMFVVPMAEMVLGFFYISTSYHERLLEAREQRTS
ncbi:MAG: YybS family protein [Clostridiales bacterium]|nr:YybS family protein [Clostridiales bacterium]